LFETAELGTAGTPEVPSVKVPSVQKAVQILSLIVSRNEALGASAIARELSLPKSTVFNICDTLTQTKMLTRSADSLYSPGPKTLILGRGYVESVDPVRSFGTEAARIDELAKETLVLAVLDGAEVVYAATRRGNQRMGFDYEVGLRLPAHCTASGKAFLSLLPEKRITEIFGKGPLEPMTSNSMTSVPDLLEELSLSRTRGYSVDDEEASIGMFCLGAPVRGASGEPIAAVSVTSVKAALDDEKIQTYSLAIRRLADALSTMPVVHD
jgi:DNA-binding IclR family transcriptional regulator